MSEVDKNDGSGPPPEAAPKLDGGQKQDGKKPERKAGPGRPPGAKNKNRPDLPDPKPRKSASSKAQPGRAADRHLKAYQEHMDVENKRRKASGLEPLPVAAEPEKATAPTPRYPLEVCQSLVAGTLNGMGELLNVESRPSPEALQTMARGLHETSAYFDILHPKYIALTTLVMGTVQCTAPMVREWRETKKAGGQQQQDNQAPAARFGDDAPAGERPN